MIFCLLAYFTLAAAAEIFKRPKPLSAIETKIELVPFLVSIQSKIITDDCVGITCGTWQHICSGIIVSERHVITAASCFFETKPGSEEKQERDPYNILVLAGSDKTNSGRRMAISHFCYHKQYNVSSSSESYALVFLHETFTFGKKVKVAKVPRGRYKDSSKEIEEMIENRKVGEVYGWNMKESTEKSSLLMVQVHLSDAKICRDSPKTSEINVSQHFCGVATADSLEDMGSPLVIDDVVWGFYIASEQGSQAATLFSRLDVALNWKAIVISSAQPSIVFHYFNYFYVNRIIIFFSLTVHTINYL